MVSNSLKISQQEIIKALKRLRREQSDNPEYRKLADLNRLLRSGSRSTSSKSCALALSLLEQGQFFEQEQVELGFWRRALFLPPLMGEDEDGGAHCCEM